MSTCQTCFHPGRPVMRVVHDDDPWCQNCIDTFNAVMGAFSTIIPLGPYEAAERGRRPVIKRPAGLGGRKNLVRKQQAVSVG